MANEAQIIFEYSAGNDVEIKSEDLKIKPERLFVQITARPDGNIYTDDPNITQDVFTGTGVIEGASANELYDVMHAAIVYDGTYPRIKKIHWSGALTETNIPVSGVFIFSDFGSERWGVQFILTEYTA